MPYSFAQPATSAPLSKVRSELAIKRAKFEHMPRVTEIIGSSAEWYRKIVDPKDMPEHEPDERWIAKNFFRRDFYMGWDGTDAVGVISLQNLRGFSYLGYIYLDTAHTGRGFGQQLIRFAEDRSRALQRRGMVLIAHPEATWATRAYEKYGFQKIASRRADVLGWEDGALDGYYEEGFDLYQIAF